MKISKEKLENLKKLANEDGVIAALAIDQRGSMEKMMKKANESLNNVEGISEFKRQVSKELTPFSSSILRFSILYEISTEGFAVILKIKSSLLFHKIFLPKSKNQ